MTLNEANNLNEQLKELEQIEMEKKHKNSGGENVKKSPIGAQLASSLFGLSNNSQASGSASPTLKPGGFNLSSFADILNNAGNEFEREWEAAFTTTNNNKSDNHGENANPTTSTNDINFFTSNTTDESNALLFADLLNNNEQLKLDLNLIETNNAKSTTSLLNNKKVSNELSSLIGEKQTSSSGSGTNKSKAWYDLFAELDPIKNPDTIGKESDKDERNC